MSAHDEAASSSPRRYALPNTKAWRRTDTLLLALITLLALTLRLWNLGFPDHLYYDETYYVDAAQKLMAGQPDPNDVHPPLGKWMIGLGIDAGSHLFGSILSEPATWRIASVFAGTTIVSLTYLLGLMLFSHNRLAASLAGLIVATEHLHLTCSRLAFLDPFVSLFCLLGTLLAYRYFYGAKEYWGALSALTLGLATGCKWNGLFTAFGCLVLGCWLTHAKLNASRAWRYALWLALGLPLGFFLSYTHLFLSHGLHLDTFYEILSQAERMIKFRMDAQQFSHRYGSYFWSWPLMLQPSWFYFKTLNENHTIEAIGALANPILWWGCLLLILEKLISVLSSKKAYAKLHSKQHALGTLIILWFCQWLPWAISYTGGFFYYMVVQVPIMALIAGQFLANLFESPPSSKERWKGGILLSSYLVTATLYFPFVLGKPVSEPYLHKLFFEQWIVGNPQADHRLHPQFNTPPASTPISLSADKN